jgi:HEAT repeat protein
MVETGELSPDAPGRAMRRLIEQARATEDKDYSEADRRIDLEKVPPDRHEAIKSTPKLGAVLAAQWRAGQIKPAAAEALGSILSGQGAPQTAPAVAALTEALYQEVTAPPLPTYEYSNRKWPLCDALQRLDPNWHQSPRGQAVVRALVSQLGDPNARYVHPSADRLLAVIGCPQAAEGLLERIKKVEYVGAGHGLLSQSKESKKLRLVRDFTEQPDDMLATALVASADRSTLPAAMELLKSKDPNKRTVAIAVLGHIGGPEAVATLIGLVDDKDMGTDAMLALGMTHSKDAVAPLVRAASATVADPAVAFDRLPAKDKQRFLRLGGSRERAIVRFRGENPDPAYFKKFYAIVVLGRLGGKDALAALQKAAKDEELGYLAIQALADTRDPAAVETLMDALSDRSPNVVVPAAAGLAEMGQQKAAEKIASLLETDSQSDRSSYHHSQLDMLAEALGKLRARQAIGPLVVALANGTRSALAALMQIDPDWRRSSEARQALPALKACLNDRDSAHQRMAALLIGVLGEKQSLTLLAEKMGKANLGPGMIEALQHADPQWRSAPAVRVRLAELVAMVKDYKPLSKEALEKLPFETQMKTAEEEARRIGNVVEASLILGETRPESGEDALIDCLVRLGDPNAAAGKFEVPGTMMAFDSTAVQIVCAQALGTLKSRRAVPSLIAMIAPSKGAERRALSCPVKCALAIVAALGKIGDPAAIDPLTGILTYQNNPQSRAGEDEGKQMCFASAHAIAAIGGDKALSALTKSLEHPLSIDAASDALAELGDRRAAGPLLARIGRFRWNEPQVRAALDCLDPKWRARPEVDAMMAEMIATMLSLDEPPTNPTYPGRQVDFDAEGMSQLDPNWQKSDLAKAATARLCRRLKFQDELEENDVYNTVRRLEILSRPESVGPLKEAMGRFKRTRDRIEETLNHIDPDWRTRKTPTTQPPPSANGPEGFAAGPPDVAAAISALAGKDVRERLAAVRTLAGLTDANSIKAVVGALSDKDIRVSEAAASAIDASQNPPAIAATLAALPKDDGKIRRDSGFKPSPMTPQKELLLSLSGSWANKPLVDALKSADKHVRAAAVVFLGTAGNYDAVEPLIAAITDPYDKVRENAVESLNTITHAYHFDTFVDSPAEGKAWWQKWWSENKAKLRAGR